MNDIPGTDHPSPDTGDAPGRNEAPGTNDAPGRDDLREADLASGPAGLDEPVRGPLPEDYRSGFAALVGRANVGKSTLINQLVGQKIAIVSHVAQTTRNRILGVRTLPHGQVAFLDSPGFHKPQHQMGQMMMETARQVAGEAEVLLLVIDAAAGFGPGDRYVLEELKGSIGDRPLVIVLNKVDGLNKGKLLPMIEEAVGEWGATDAVPVSALTGENCDRLLDVVLKHLPPGPPLFPDDFVTDQDERRFIAEVIREKLLAGLRQEVPHSIAVMIERIENREDGIAEIHAAILVERETQKAIVIGRQGARLKEVGTAARRELEKRVGKQVFLKLWVKVREDWRDKVGILRDIGILPG